MLVLVQTAACMFYCNLLQQSPLEHPESLSLGLRHLWHWILAKTTANRPSTECRFDSGGSVPQQGMHADVRSMQQVI